MPLQLRRGVESDRSSVTPDAGEPLWVTDTSKLYIGDGSTAGGVLVSGGTDSANVQAIIDSNFGAIGGDLVPAADSTYDLGTAAKKWKDLHLSGNSIFLGGHKIVKDGNTIKFTDSNGNTINVTASNVAASLIDSSDVISIVDSAYVQVRQDKAYSSLTGAPTNVSSFTNDAGYTAYDSANTTGMLATYATQSYVDGAVAALPDSAQVATIVTSYGYTTYDSANAAGQITAYGYTTFDSANASGLITTAINNLVDAAPSALDTLNELAAALGDDANFATTVTNSIAALPDSAQVATIVTSYGYTTYDSANTTGMLATYATQSYVDGAVAALPDSAQVATIVTSYGYSTYDSANFSGQLAAASTTDLSEGSNLYYTDARVTTLVDSAYVQARQADIYRDSGFVTNIIDSAYINARVSATDSAAVISIVTGTVDSAYVQARQTPQDFAYSSLTGAPTTVSTFTNDANYIATNDSATLASITTTGNIIVGGNLQVNGTTVTVNATDLDVTDNMIYMNAGESAGSPTASIDVGWAANVNDQGSYEHVGLFRDATDQTFKVFQGYTPEPDAAVQINTGHASFALAPFAASTLTGVYQGFDSDVTAAGLATQTYVTSTIDSAYINARVVIPAAFDSADVIGIVDSAYIAARTSAGTDSATVVSLITGTVDSAYVQARTDNGVGLKFQQFTFTADSGDTTFTGVDDFGRTLQYVQNKIEVFYNGILLSPSDYTATNGTSIVFNSAADSADNIIISSYTTTSELDSAAVTAIASTVVTSTVDSAYVQARQDYAYSSLTGAPTNVSTFTNDAGYTTYDSANASGQITAAIDALVAGAPAALDTLNEIAAALNDDDSAYNSLVALISAKSDYDSANFTGQLTSATGSSVQAYDANLTSFVSTFTLPTSDGTPNQVLVTNGSGTISFADQSGGLDSAATIALIDSAYVAARTSAGTDSATVVSLITGTVDSAYVAARAGAAGLDSAAVLALTGVNTVTATTYEFTATASQQTFSGTDDNSATLAYTAGNILVHRNGILLVSTVDYTATNGTSINLQAGADSGDTISITAYQPTLVNATETTITSTVQEADSGQTSFTISHTQDQILVFLNGILLKDSDDYTSNGSTIVLTSAADSGDQITVHNFGKYGQAGYGNLTTSGTTSTFAGTLLSTGRIVENYAATGSIIDLSVANYFSHTAVADTTFSVVNTLDSDKVNSIVLELTNGGDHTITWWSGVTWAGGSAPTLTSSGTDIIGFYSYTGGTTWRGLVLAQAIA